MVTNGNVMGSGTKAFAFTSDSNRVIYLADQDTDEVNDLYSVNVDGTDLVKLNQGVSGLMPERFGIIEGSNSVLVGMSDDHFGVDQLYTVSVNGSGWAKVTEGTDAVYPQVYMRDLVIDTRMFMVSQDYLVYANDFTDKLVLSKRDGSSRVQLGFARIKIDSSGGDYHAGIELDSVNSSLAFYDLLEKEVFLTKFSGSEKVKISIHEDSELISQSISIDPVNQRVYYFSTDMMLNAKAVYRAKYDGSEQQQINIDIPSNAIVSWIRFNTISNKLEISCNFQNSSELQILTYDLTE
jgi:hypothetical protein